MVGGWPVFGMTRIGRKDLRIRVVVSVVSCGYSQDVIYNVVVVDEMMVGGDTKNGKETKSGRGIDERKFMNR